jgi:phosphatidylinositol alpha-1,6-mannosyltransferase
MSKVRRIKYGVFVYGFDLLHPQARSYRGIFNALLRGADFIFADSKEAANIALNLGVMAGNIHLVNPCVDTSSKTGGITANIVRKRYGLENKKCILMVGRLVERKGCDTVINALPTVLRSVPDAHFLVAGMGPMQDKLSAHVENLKLQDSVTFAGFIPDEELAAYYQACDVFVMISRELRESGDIEGFGIVYLEANLQGKPVVAGRSGGVPDAVVHGETGLLVDPNDTQEVAFAIIRILKDASLAQLLGENGKRRVLKDFTIEKAAISVQEAISIK